MVGIGCWVLGNTVIILNRHKVVVNFVFSTLLLNLIIPRHLAILPSRHFFNSPPHQFTTFSTSHVTKLPSLLGEGPGVGFSASRVASLS